MCSRTICACICSYVCYCSLSPCPEYVIPPYNTRAAEVWRSTCVHAAALEEVQMAIMSDFAFVMLLEQMQAW